MDRSAVATFVKQQLGRYTLDTSTLLPLFGQIPGGSDGDVKLPHYAGRSRRTRRQTVFSPAGEQARVVTFDRSVSVLAAGEGRVLTEFVDELDVVAIGVYRYDLGW